MADAGLFSCKDTARWRDSLGKYDSVVAELSKRKSAGKSGKKTPSLKTLDDWFHNVLSKSVKSRKERYLTHDELVQLMQWKLTRGKFRPRLNQLVAENKPSDVQLITKRAFSLLPDLKQAVEELCKLKAVGPATASAILCSGAPEFVPFMADESVTSVPGLLPIQYTLSHYLRYAASVTSKARWLKANDKSHQWTVHDVEVALWVDVWSGKLELEDKTETEKQKSTSLKRKVSDGEVDQPAKKKSR